MAKEKIVNNLCALAMGRYRREKPRTKITHEMRESIYYSVLGVYEKQGEAAAYSYVKTAKLLG